MALKFQKRIRIAPGVRLNISKTGISGTIGPRGASVNVGKKGVYANAGLPGTGLSTRTRLDRRTDDSGDVVEAAPAESTAIERFFGGLGVVAVVGLILWVLIKVIF